MRHERDSPVESPYEVLGVKTTASATEIATAYKRLAIVHHPDRQHPSDAEALERGKAEFQRIVEAYKILTTRELKDQYDTMHGLNLNARVADFCRRQRDATSNNASPPPPIHSPKQLSTEDEESDGSEYIPEAVAPRPLSSKEDKEKGPTETVVALKRSTTKQPWGLVVTKAGDLEVLSCTSLAAVQLPAKTRLVAVDGEPVESYQDFVHAVAKKLQILLTCILPRQG